MSISDPIADMFTRIRNAFLAKHKKVIMPYSNMKTDIAKILEIEGFVNKFEVNSKELTKKELVINLKYDESGNSIIEEINRISKPGKRIYVQKSQIPKVMNGFGISIISTPKGILSGRAARLANVGGELLGEVF